MGDPSTFIQCWYWEDLWSPYEVVKYWKKECIHQSRVKYWICGPKPGASPPDSSSVLDRLLSAIVKLYIVSSETKVRTCSVHHMHTSRWVASLETQTKISPKTQKEFTQRVYTNVFFFYSCELLPFSFDANQGPNGNCSAKLVHIELSNLGWIFWGGLSSCESLGQAQGRKHLSLDAPSMAYVSDTVRGPLWSSLPT